MNDYLFTNPWYLVEDNFQPLSLANIENKFSISNGYMHTKAHFEEFYSGETEISNFAKGFYKLLSTNGELSNLPNWTSLHIRLNAEMLDLARCEIISFRIMLDMQHNTLERIFEVFTLSGNRIEVTIKRFLSLAQTEVGAIKYSIKSLNFTGRISFNPVVDGAMYSDTDEDNEPDWNVIQSQSNKDVAHLWIQMRHSRLQLCSALTFELFKNNAPVKLNATKIEKKKVAGYSVGCDVKPNDTVFLNKYITALNSNNHFYKDLTNNATALALEIKLKGWNTLLAEHIAVSEERWSNVEIDKIDNIEKQQAEIYSHFKRIYKL